MPFICTLDPDLPLVLTQISSEAGQGETIVRIPVGLDDETGAVFSIFVCLATLPGYGAMRHELVFYLVCAVNDDEDFFRDGLETKVIITDHMDRKRILGAICL